MLHACRVLDNCGCKCSIVDIITASPPGLVKSDLAPTGYPSEWYINVTWTPDISQYGPNIFCFSAQDNMG